jgi:hypothetical protein
LNSGRSAARCCASRAAPEAETSSRPPRGPIEALARDPQELSDHSRHPRRHPQLTATTYENSRPRLTDETMARGSAGLRLPANRVPRGRDAKVQGDVGCPGPPRPRTREAKCAPDTCGHVARSGPGDASAAAATRPCAATETHVWPPIRPNRRQRAGVKPSAENFATFIMYPGSLPIAEVIDDQAVVRIEPRDLHTKINGDSGARTRPVK